eukprot:scaffold2319_cov406-Prasinococcus_capsulatus_cf.AAC.9
MTDNHSFSVKVGVRAEKALTPTASTTEGMECDLLYATRPEQAVGGVNRGRSGGCSRSAYLR